ncbi:MAG: J domain-containing protein [Actinobacteria bacterium]|nr:J domain-containing protein [Actinomycetota bacterium]
MIVAEFEVWHSRPVAPTRRVAISGGHLPVDPTPGYGGLLLAGIVASYVECLDDDLRDDLYSLITELENGHRVPQPVLRHRLQVDRVGLSSSTHRLRATDDQLVLELAKAAPPMPQILACVYRIGQMQTEIRRSLMTIVRSAAAWSGGPGPEVLPWLAGAAAIDLPRLASVDPQAWAMDVFGLEPEGQVSKRSIQRRFRTLLREAHPDHGGKHDTAAEAIDRLNAARTILLAEGA